MFIVIPGISLYRVSLYRGSTVIFCIKITTFVSGNGEFQKVQSFKGMQIWPCMNVEVSNKFATVGHVTCLSNTTLIESLAMHDVIKNPKNVYKYACMQTFRFTSFKSFCLRERDRLENEGWPISLS